MPNLASGEQVQPLLTTHESQDASGPWRMNSGILFGFMMGMLFSACIALAWHTSQDGDIRMMSTDLKVDNENSAVTLKSKIDIRGPRELIEVSPAKRKAYTHCMVADSIILPPLVFQPARESLCLCAVIDVDGESHSKILSNLHKTAQCAQQLFQDGDGARVHACLHAVCPSMFSV